MSITSGRRLVGRSGERRRLGTWLEEVAAGTGRVLVVRGEAGIGKSTLLADLIDTAVERGFAVARGASEQDSPVPYHALVGWFDHLTDRPPPTAEVGHLETIFARLAALATPVAPDAAETSQVSLHMAVSGVVRAAAQRQALLLVLDDAHWVDESSAALVRHLVGALTGSGASAGAGLGVVIGTRPDERDGAAPRLSRLTRMATVDVIDLDSLDEMATAQLVERRWGWSVPAPTAAQLREVSGGVPLAVVTTVERGLRQGALVVRDGDLLVEHGAALVPVAVDVDLRSRIDALEPAGQTVVSWMAVLGERVGLDILHLLGDRHGIDVDLVVDDLVDLGVVDDIGAHLAFVHSAFRSAALDRLGARQRARMHAEVGTLLAGRGDGAVVEAAHHLELAGHRADPAMVLATATRAGEICAARFTWGQAARFLTAALDAHERLGTEPDDSLRLQLAVAQYCCYDSERSLARSLEVAARARERGDVDLWGRAATLALQIRLNRRPPSEVGRPVETDDLRAWLEVAGDGHDERRAEALAMLASLDFAEARPDDGRGRADRALGLARTTADHALRSSIEFILGLSYFGTLDLDPATEWLEASRASADRAGHVGRSFAATTRLAMIDHIRGRPRKALADLAAAATDGTSGLFDERAFSAAIEAAGNAALGKVNDVEMRAAEAFERYDFSGYAYVPLVAAPALAGSRAWRGDRTGAVAVLRRWEGEAPERPSRWRRLVDLIAGSPDDRAALRRELAGVDSLLGGIPGRGLFGAGEVAAQVEIGIVLDLPHLVAQARDDLAWLDGRGVRLLPAWPLFIPRIAAGAIAALDGAEAARDRFVRAESEAADGGLDVEHSRVVLDRVRVGLGTEEEGRRAAAHLELLGLAALVPEELQGLVRGPGPSGPRVVVFCDLVGSTARNIRAGDTRYARLISDLTDLLRELLERTRGREFKHTGDGLACWFSDAAEAIGWAADSLRALPLVTAGTGEDPLELSFGIAAGEPVDRAGDLFGVAVSLAARLSDRAPAGQILVSEEVCRMAAGSGRTFEPAGAFTLKGFPAPVPVFRAG